MFQDIRIQCNGFSNCLLNCKRLYTFLLSFFLINGCTNLPPLQTDVFHGSTETVALIVFVDTPFMTLKTIEGETETGQIPFYHWIFKGFRYQTGQSMVLFDDMTVVSHAIAQDIKPVVSYRQRYGMLGVLDNLTGDIKPVDIIHLAFDESQIPALYNVAKELGASFLIKARLISNNAKLDKRTQCTYYPDRIFAQVECRVQVWKQAVTAEFRIYDVSKENIMLTLQFTTIHKAGVGEGLGTLSGLYSDISRKLASAVVAAISRRAQSQELASKLGSSNISAENRPKIWKESGAPISLVTGHYFDVWVKNTSIIDDNLIRFDISFLNRTEQKLGVTFKKDMDNKLDTYIEDKFGITYNAIGSSIEGYSFDIRAGEQEEFSLLFPLTAIPDKQVNLFTTWNIQTTQGTYALSFEFKDVHLPSVLKSAK